jgi:hypothetical protein
VSAPVEYVVRGQRFKISPAPAGYTLEQWSHLHDEWAPLAGWFATRRAARAYARWVASS